MAPITAPKASARPGRQNRGSRPYCQHQEEQDERRKHQGEIAADGEELQNVKPRRGVLDEGCNRSVRGIPDQIVQLDDKTRWPGSARRWHVAHLARVKYGCAVNSADRLRKARGRILRYRTGVGIAAIPGRSAPYLVRGQSMNGKGGD